MSKFQELQTRHLELVARYEQDKSSKALLDDVQAYVEQVRLAGREIGDSRERNQLRANIRFWGAYIYDHTGTYPNLDMLPSEAGTATHVPKSRAVNIRWVVLISIIFLAIVLLILARGALLQANVPPPTLAATNMPIDTNSLFATPGTGATQLSDVEIFATGTAVALLTQSAVHSATPTATLAAAFTQIPGSTQTTIATSVALTVIPPAGFVPSSTYSAPKCSNREIAIAWRDFEWNTNLLPSLSKIEPPVAYLSLFGSGQVVSKVKVVPNGSPTIIKLGNSRSDQSYFLQIKHAMFLFQPMIIQFTSDCAHNNLSVTYSGHGDVIDNSTLNIDLTLVDWGPDSYPRYQSWIAKLSISQDERGIYLYNSGELIEKTLFVRGFGCSSQPFKLSRTSNGKYQEVFLSLFLAGPLCPK